MASRKQNADKLAKRAEKTKADLARLWERADALACTEGSAAASMIMTAGNWLQSAIHELQNVDPREPLS